MSHDRRCPVPSHVSTGGRPGRWPRVVLTASLSIAMGVLGALTSRQARAADFTSDYFCYNVKASKGSAKFSPVPNTQIEDPFENLVFTVNQPREFCNPALEAAGSVNLTPLVHFDVYQITLPKKTPRSLPQDVTVDNEFGTIQVDAVASDKFFVPAHKSLTAPPPAPEHPGIDHFKCYDVKLHQGSTLAKQQITLMDQFTGTLKTFDVLEPEHLCPVARKNTENVVDCCDAFVCYTLRAAKGAPKFTPVKNVYATDQFGSLTLDVTREDDVCVRSTITGAGQQGTCLTSCAQ